MKLDHPLIRYHGGKFRLADWIISHFPKHETYVEPFGGGASVLLSKVPSGTEIYNDLDAEVVNFFKVLRCEAKRMKLIEQLELTPYARDEFLEAYSHDLTDGQHVQLLDLILSLKGKVILSGYQSYLYESKLKNWKKSTKSTQASGASGGVTREEVLWINPRAEKQGDLFGGVA